MRKVSWLLMPPTQVRQPEVAEAVATEIAKKSEVEIQPLEKVTSLEAYSAVVLGAPMILGWHAEHWPF